MQHLGFSPCISEHPYFFETQYMDDWRFFNVFFVAMKKCVVPNAGIFAFANRMENVTMFVKQR